MSDEAVVRLGGLVARDHRGAVQGLSLALPAGALGALVGNASDGTTALARVLCGVDRPRGGVLTVAGASPYSTPELRGRIGALLDDPQLPDVGRVKDLLVFARMLRGAEAVREDWYDPLGLADLGRLMVSALDRRQRRTVALGLALAVPAPVLVVLHEPLSEVLRVDRATLRTVLRKRAALGACVVVLTGSMRDAASLADDVATLQRGRVGRAIGAPDIDELAPGSEIQLDVWSDMPRALASALTLEPSIRAVTWSARDGAPVSVRSVALDEVCAAVARVAKDNGARIEAIRPVVPSLGEVNAASAGLALAERYEAAYRAASRGRGSAT